MVLGIALGGATLNARKQFNVTEKANKATDLAEMGITYYLNVNNSLIGPAEARSNLTNFYTEFTSRLKASSIYQPQRVDDNNSYQILFDSSRTTSLTQFLLNPDVINIGFKSIGTSGSNSPVTLEGSFKLTKNRVGEPAPLLSLFINGVLNTAYSSTNLINYGVVDITQKEDYTLDNLALFDSLTLKGDGNERYSFTINNDTIFLNTISMNGHTKLTINGDAIFFNIEPIDKLTKKADICITGNTYTVSNGKLVDLDISAFNACADTNSQNEWSINPNGGITVIYPK